MRGRSLVLVAVLAIAAASCGQVSDSSGLSSTIAVHGDWTIDVYNPDGTLDRHTEFSNHLTENGAEVLARLSAGDWVAQGWYIEVDSASNVALCPNDVFLEGCLVGGDEANGSTTAGALTLTGSQTATNAGQIGSVATWLAVCPPSGCGFGSTALRVIDITATDITDPATGGEYVIAEGQTFDITVEISFTSG